MDPPKHRVRDDAASFPNISRAVRGLELEGPVRPRRVVVLDVLTEQPPQVTLVERDEVVRALAPQRPNQALGDRIRLRCADRS